MVKTAYTCIGANVWGRGTTVDEAKDQCRKAAGLRKGRMPKGGYIVYRVVWDTDKITLPEGATGDQPYVDQYGYHCYYGTSEEIENTIPQRKPTKV
jgi:hypothetical protein